MVDEISRRIWEWLPGDLTDRGEIRDAIWQSGWSQNWGGKRGPTMNQVVDSIMDDRVSVAPDIRDVINARTDVMGPAEPDLRQDVIRAADGTTLGPQEHVSTWEDRWGNLMGHNDRTGTRKKIADKDER